MQIRQYIMDNIQQKKWKPNDKIPSENELAEQFKVSRITVKKALDSLVEEGIIYRIQGRGSFVAKEEDSENIIYQNKVSQQNSSKLIACIIPRLNSQFITIMVGEIEKLLSQHGYRVILCQTYDSQQLETQTLKEVLRLGVDGIIIYPAEGETYNEEILKLTIEKFPLVLIDRYFRGIGANSVCTDNILGAYEATKHLLDLGHAKIGIISSIPEGTTSIEDRIKGFEKALTEYNIPIDHHLYLLDLTLGEHDNANKDKIRDFLSNHRDITALFVINNGLTVMEVALEMGYTIPQDLSIIMFDDYEFSHLLKVPPTCMRQQEKLLGQEAVKLIISTIENPLQKRQQIFVPPKLIVRSSTAPFKVKSN